MLSFIPFLQQAPTHRQTGNTADTPNGAGDSLKSQDTSQQGEVAASSVDDPYGPRRWRSSMVELSGKDRALNEFCVERIGEEADQNLVILHGYGAGLGFFYKNFEPLSRAKGWTLYALDMLGMGRSTRPPFKIKPRTGRMPSPRRRTGSSTPWRSGASSGRSSGSPSSATAWAATWPWPTRSSIPAA